MELISQQYIENKIHSIRGLQVMLDSVLAEMYQVETLINLQSQIATTKSSTLPYVFTEQGIAMLYIAEPFIIAKCDLKEISEIRSQIAALKNSDIKLCLWN